MSLDSEILSGSSLMLKYVHILMLVIAVICTRNLWNLMQAPSKREYLSAKLDQTTVNSNPSVNKSAIVFIDRESCNLGKIPADSTARASIGILNTSQEDIRILNVIPGCGCTSAVPQERMLEPGQQSQLDVAVKVRSKVGPMSVRITIELENQSGIKFTESVFITGVVIPIGGISIDPEVINFGRVRKIDVRRRTAVLTFLDGNDVPPDTSLKVFSTPSGVTCDIESVGRQRRMTIFLNGRDSAESGSGHIKLCGGDRSDLFVNIPVLWRFDTQVRAMPTAVIEVWNELTKNGMRKVVFSRGSDESLQILKAQVVEQSIESGIHVEVNSSGASAANLSWSSASDPVRDYTGFLEVHLVLDNHHGRQETARVPIIIRRRSTDQCLVILWKLPTPTDIHFTFLG